MKDVSPDCVTSSTVEDLSAIVTQSSGRGSAGLVGSCVTDELSRDRASSDGVPQRPARPDATPVGFIFPAVLEVSYFRGGVRVPLRTRHPSSRGQIVGESGRAGPGPHDGELVGTIRPADRHVVPGGHRRQFSPSSRSSLDASSDSCICQGERWAITVRYFLHSLLSLCLLTLPVRLANVWLTVKLI